MDTYTQKIENILNLAMDATLVEREKSVNLGIGYDIEEETWEVIIKYYGGSNILEVLRNKNFLVVSLYNQYAIVTVPASRVKELASLAMVEYMEKPKGLYYERTFGNLVTGIDKWKTAPFLLSGKGVIVGILDSGIDYRGKEFTNADGTTRILNIWDQTLEGNPPEGYNRGTEFTKADIDRGVDLKTKDLSGHGTEVAAIAAGNQGVAYESEIIMVKLGISKLGGFPRTTELMEGLDYLVKKAMEYYKPLVVNISIGNVYGSHDGKSLLEQFIDDISKCWKISICVGMGNEGRAAGHGQGALELNRVEYIEFTVDVRQVAFNIQLWKRFEDDIQISLITPWGEVIGPLLQEIGTKRYIVRDTEVLLYYGEASPYNILQEIYFEFIPINSYVSSGIWKIKLNPTKIVTGQYDLWLSDSITLNKGTQFSQPSKNGTVTIPATASRVISVGAYNGRTLTYADFSGRGISNIPSLVKPDLVAPGVEIQTITAGGNYVNVTGTSFATPFVTGSGALLMEWGIVQGNDIYMYGDKLKATLRKEATPLLGEDKYPNNQVGYGKLDLFDTFENIRRL